MRRSPQLICHLVYDQTILCDSCSRNRFTIAYQCAILYVCRTTCSIIYSNMIRIVRRATLYNVKITMLCGVVSTLHSVVTTYAVRHCGNAVQRCSVATTPYNVATTPHSILHTVLFHLLHLAASFPMTCSDLTWKYVA